MGMLVVPYDSNLSWNIYSSQTKEALRDHLPEGRPILGMYNNTTHGFLKEVYMAYCENKSNQTHYSLRSGESAETQEASLILDIVHAQCDVHRAEKILAECIVREDEKIVNLHHFKANQVQDTVDNLDLDIGWINAVFNNHGRSQPTPPLRSSTSLQKVPDTDGALTQIVAGRLLTCNLN